MKDIEVFENVSEWKEYLKSKGINKYNFIDSGSEGECFLPRINGDIYKIFNNNSMSNNYDYKKVITMKEINISSFLFPKKLFLVKDKLVGYTTDYVKHDFLKDNDGILPDINFNKLYLAYKTMYEDVIELSNSHVLIDDLPYNLLFNGKKLYAVDTCNYSFNFNNVKKDNIRSLKIAIVEELNMLLGDIKQVRGNNIEMYEYLTKFEKKYTKVKKAKFYL